jgi:hypothetical protein
MPRVALAAVRDAALEQAELPQVPATVGTVGVVDVRRRALDAILQAGALGRRRSEIDEDGAVVGIKDDIAGRDVVLRDLSETLCDKSREYSARGRSRRSACG